MDRNVQKLCVKIIALLREERERRKLSKYFIAQESGMSPQMIAYVENGERRPTLETVLQIARAMDIDLEDVIIQARKEISKPGK